MTNNDKQFVQAVTDFRLDAPKQEPFDWEKEKKSYLDEIDRLGVESNRDEEEIDRLTQLLTPPDQKPVAWMYDWKTPIGKNREVQHVFRDKNHLTDDLTVISNHIENVRPLYLAPPTREPLIDKEIQDALIRCRQSTTWDYGFEAGVLYAEKAHGIGL